AIAALVSAQVIGRLADAALRALGQPRYGFLVPPLAEIGGFLLVAATFLALASTLRHAVHIRVNLLLQHLPERPRRALQVASLAAAAAMIGYATVQAIVLAMDSWRFGELSYGIVAVPLVIPKAALAAGLAILTIALIDDLFAALAGRPPSFEAAEAASQRALQAEGLE
ncbi:MAG TPA: TRAP transporter small permease subunit, partial [Afifellaceae bacterium]|nr:TRAP transporter small permease subunit [Afifellaceae bacterium]